MHQANMPHRRPQSKIPLQEADLKRPRVAPYSQVLGCKAY
jgi:hypothetical protein